MKSSEVILIGGCPGAGKTTLGRTLAARLDYASLTIDDLCNAAKAVTTPESHPGLHVINQPNYTDYFTNSPVEKLIADATEQHQAIWPAVELTIRNHANWGTPIVIDGWHLRPEWVHPLELTNMSSHWLVIDPDVLITREQQNTDFISQSKNPTQMLNQFVSRSLWSNELIKQEAAKVGLPVLYQDGSKTVEDLCDEALSQIA